MSGLMATFTIGKEKNRGELSLVKFRHFSEVIRENTKTIIVTAPDGTPVKRHKIKHGVVFGIQSLSEQVLQEGGIEKAQPKGCWAKLFGLVEMIVEGVEKCLQT